MTVGVNETVTATNLNSQRTGIPFIVAPTGTMANNGAVTLGTALQATYLSSYLFLPASAVVAGSAAGWYYTVFSSTTVGTVFANTYVAAQVVGANAVAGGAPVIPSVPTAFVTVGPGAFTGVTTPVTGPALLIPANQIGPFGSLRIMALASVNSSVGNKTIALGIGTIAAPVAFTTVVATTSIGQKISTDIFNRGSSTINVSNPAGAYGPGAGVAALVVSNINFAVANYLVPILTVATATDTLVLEAMLMESFTF